MTSWHRVSPPLLVVALCVMTLSACSGSSGPSAAAPTSSPSSTTPASASPASSSTTSTPGVDAGPDAAGTVWLCRPGQAGDPCASDRTATVVRADGSTAVQHSIAVTDPPIDCFYVYPTVSPETGQNADLTVQPAETHVAVAQASRFSSVCKVYAPMYPQLTLSAIARPITAAGAATAYLGVLAAWRDYLANDNHGRGVVLIGHSQGASMLVALIHREIDPDPSLRRLLVSAVILGGNVTVPVGGTVGGSFTNVPACRSTDQTGCVVAYSSFDAQPPTDSLFGRPGGSLADRSGITTPPAGMQVLCTNPAALGGSAAALLPYFPTGRTGASSGDTPWVAYPRLYTGTCRSAGGATWLQVDTARSPGDTRPVVSQTLGSRWGLHLVDVNIALGDLVTLVAAQSAAFARR